VFIKKDDTTPQMLRYITLIIPCSFSYSHTQIVWNVTLIFSKIVQRKCSCGLLLGPLCIC